MLTDEATAGIEVQVHLAEYNALSTRRDYFIVTSFSVWPLAVLFLALMGQSHFSWVSKVWCSLAGLQALTIMWYYCIWEQYASAHYTECSLKPKIVVLLRHTDFWNYDDQLRKLGRKIIMLGDWWAFSAITLGLPIAFLAQSPWSDGYGKGLILFSLNALLYAGLALMLYKTLDERRKWTGETVRVGPTQPAKKETSSLPNPPTASTP